MLDWNNSYVMSSEWAEDATLINQRVSSDKAESLAQYTP
jgi:hypothetical protein